MYYFKKNFFMLEFFNICFFFKDLLSLKLQFLLISVVNFIQMNFVFIDLYVCVMVVCDGDFDKFFVLFCCIVLDVYNKKQLILKCGDLGDVVWVFMSFFFMFKFIEIDSMLVYDGGIYNNFLIDVMCEDFYLDIIIGSVVFINLGKLKENDLMSQIENMVMQKIDYFFFDFVGILMIFKYNDVSLMDF